MGPKDKQDPKKEEEETIEEEGTEEELEEQDDPEGEEAQEEEDLSPEELKAQLAKTKKDLRAANKESKERRLRLEALDKEKKEKEEAELSESERLKKQAAEREAELEKIRAENRELKLSGEFSRAAADLKLTFVSEKSRETAFKLLDPEALEEDFEGIEDELKRLAKDHSYLFGKPDPNQFINDGRRKDKTSSATVTRKVIENKRRRITPL